MVTGGSGFIGTALCKLLVEVGHDVFNIDRKKKEIDGVTQYAFDLNNPQIHGIVNLIKPDTIIHLAAEHEVARSLQEPDVYYTNNVVNTINLANWAAEAGVKNFVYSSSSTVYGNAKVPTPEDHVKSPTTPYGRTKSICEEILMDYAEAGKFNAVILRYFNAAGALPDNTHGYTQDPASHVIPILARAAVRGLKFVINGSEYNTPDGTCWRDYTHVCDVAEAHILAMDYIAKTGGCDVFNIGTGVNHGIYDLFNMMEHVVGKRIDVEVGPERAGDIPVTQADITRAQNVLGYKPKYDLRDICTHAVAWEKKKKK